MSGRKTQSGSRRVKEEKAIEESVTRWEEDNQAVLDVCDEIYVPEDWEDDPERMMESFQHLHA